MRKSNQVEVPQSKEMPCRPIANLMASRLFMIFLSSLLVACVPAVAGEDWPQWGRNASKNMASPNATELVTDFKPGEYAGDSDDIDLSTTKNIKWVVNLGSNAYGNPTVYQGRVYVGTNNARPRDPKLKGDRSNVYCLDEKTGAFQWQFSVPKLGAGKVSDWEYLGICSSPSIEGDRVYVLTNRCEVVCLDVAGLHNGNDGPFQDEGQYMAGAGKPPIELGLTDADIIWRYNMADELGIFPHNVTSSSVLVIDNRVYANTSNGVDYSHKHIINPRSPALIALDKETGALVGEEAAGISQRVYHGSWSSPAAGLVDGRWRVFFGGGDGFCYAFDAAPVEDEDGFGILQEHWRFDCNPNPYKSVKYGTHDGPSEIIATPVFHDGHLYVPIGQDPEHGEGVGALSCIRAVGQGDVTKSGLVWQYKELGRSISTPSVANGLVYIADYSGITHCLDASTGEVYWTHDTFGHIWGSTLVADGKVFVGNEDGILTILKAGKSKQVIGQIEFVGPIYSSPVVANGTLYVMTMSHLYAIGSGRP